MVDHLCVFLLLTFVECLGLIPPLLSVHHGQKSSAYLTETLLDPKTAFSDEAKDAALSKVFDTDLPLWEWLELPENKHELKLFAMAMQGFSRLLPADAILKGESSRCLPQYLMSRQHLGIRRLRL